MLNLNSPVKETNSFYLVKDFFKLLEIDDLTKTISLPIKIIHFFLDLSQSNFKMVIFESPYLSLIFCENVYLV